MLLALSALKVGNYPKTIKTVPIPGKNFTPATITQPTSVTIPIPVPATGPVTILITIMMVNSSALALVVPGGHAGQMELVKRLYSIHIPVA